MHSNISSIESAQRGQEFLDDHVITDDVINNYLEGSEVRKIKPASEYRDEVALMFGEASQFGDRLPWIKTEDFRLRPHEITIWSGYNGSYKSMVLGQICLGLISQRKKICIASPEMPPKTTLKRMVVQYAANHNPLIETQDLFYQWVDESLWLYDQASEIQAKNLLAVVRYCVDKLGINHFVIDSLMKCGISGDDFNKQKWFVDNLCTIAKDTGVHIHLVAHRRKPSKNERTSDRFGVAGSGDIINLCDNVIDVYKKDEPNEQGIYECGLSVEKQRHYAGGMNPEPKYHFWFDGSSLQFLENEFDKPINDAMWMQMRMNNDDK